MGKGIKGDAQRHPRRAVLVLVRAKRDRDQAKPGRNALAVPGQFDGVPKLAAFGVQRAGLAFAQKRQDFIQQFMRMILHDGADMADGIREPIGLQQIGFAIALRLEKPQQHAKLPQAGIKIIQYRSIQRHVAPPPTGFATAAAPHRQWATLGQGCSIRPRGQDTVGKARELFPHVGAILGPCPSLNTATTRIRVIKIQPQHTETMRKNNKIQHHDSFDRTAGTP